jgi:uncharacterized membrane protein YdbT with pleckstrin-like domain
MGYIDENLIGGEVILYRTRLHWISMVGPCLGAFCLAIPGVVFVIGSIASRNDADVPAQGIGGFGLLLVIAAIVIVGWSQWHRSSTEMAVTNKRVLVKTGMISRNTTEMMLGKIESIVVNQGILGRMLSYGTIIVRGTGGTPEPFARIAHPLEFRKQVQQELDKLHARTAAAGTGM